MVLDLNIAGQVEEKIVQTVNTDKTRINGVYFDFNNTRAFASISFGNDINNEFEEKRVETWVLKDAYYLAMIMDNTSNGTIAQELLGKVSTAVTDIMTTTNKKEDLIASGELIILQLDLYSVTAGLVPEKMITRVSN